MTDKRIYTHVSGKAVLGLQRLVRDREIFVKPTDDGYTVVTASREKKPRGRRQYA
ncbi:hypothetical protein [Erythrobacter sp.]|uniref:hypothetical protein n=1 Tax=Erythrobacter sp. TaxID=1042 RepID=UPI0025F08221|nr:hypothetical protein [Erythrobacter sp.]